MYQTTSVKPLGIEISAPDAAGFCVVSIAKDISPDSSVPGVELWRYDYYTIPTPYSETLADEVATNLDEWIAKGVQAEKDQRGERVRAERDRILDEFDIKYCNAANWEKMTELQKEESQTYKQALRDITKQPGFPDDVEWPVNPFAPKTVVKKQSLFFV